MKSIAVAHDPIAFRLLRPESEGPSDFNFAGEN
jgi:hypothetical protein